MPAVDVGSLKFIDVRQEKVGNFIEPQALDKFLASDVGKAQEKMMREQIAQQGFKPEDISTSMIRRALFTEQASQDTGYTKPDITTKQLMDSHGPAWYQKLGDLVGNWASAGKKAPEDAVNVGATAVVTHVTNEGMTGQAATALSGRAAQIENAVNGALSGGSGPGGR